MEYVEFSLLESSESKKGVKPKTGGCLSRSVVYWWKAVKYRGLQQFGL